MRTLKKAEKQSVSDKRIPQYAVRANNVRLFPVMLCANLSHE